MISPRQGISPRPNYSWRSRLMEPNGLSSGLAESARVAPSRGQNGSSTPSAPGPCPTVSGTSTPTMSRQNSAQRAFKPVLQKRDSRDGAFRRGPETTAARSTSADRGRPKVAPVRRTCRTLSPPEYNRDQRVPPTRAGNAFSGNFSPPLATPPMGKGTVIGGSGCPHRFRGAAFEHHPRVAPPTSAPPSVAPPKGLAPSTDFDTPRSPSLKDDARSSPPSTVPQVLSGTPGSPGPKALPDTEGLCGAADGASPSPPPVIPLSTCPVITPQQLLTHDQNWKFRLDADRGAHADFVHVDEDELPKGVQAMTALRFSSAPPASPLRPERSSARNSADTRGRGPLSTDCSNFMHSEEASAEISNVSFNLSPIKKPSAGRQAICKCGEEAACRCVTRPPSPLMGTNVPPPHPTDPTAAPRRRDGLSDEANRENIQPQSKVTAMRNLWEQRSGSMKADLRGRASSATANRDSTGRGRSSSREDQQRLRRASLSRIDPKMYRRLQKEDEEAKRQARCLDELVQQLDLPGGEHMQGLLGDLDSSISSAASERLEDSPSEDKFKSLFKKSRACWRRQAKITKAVIDILSSESGRARACLSNETGPVAALPVGEAPVAPAYRAPSHPPAPALEEPQHIEHTLARELLPPLTLPTFDKAVLDFKSPPPTPQPQEEPDGPLPRKSAFEDTAMLPRRKSGMEETAMDSAMLPRKSKLDALSERPIIESSRNSTISDMEPAREPQPLGQSPRDPLSMSSSSDTPMLESPGGATSSSLHRPSASGPEHEEGIVTEADSSMETSGLGLEESANIDQAAIDQSLVDALVDVTNIRPGEDGMDRVVTMLHAIEQGELKRELCIVVPEGMGPDRKVQFGFENKSHEVVVPEGYEVGAQVLVTISNRPFLERTVNQGLRRGHQQPEFADRWSIIDNLRHSLRTDSDNSTLGADEFRNRYNLYMLLRGRCGAPLLPFTKEEEDAAVEMVGAF